MRSATNDWLVSAAKRYRAVSTEKDSHLVR